MRGTKLILSDLEHDVRHGGEDCTRRVLITVDLMEVKHANHTVVTTSFNI